MAVTSGAGTWDKPPTSFVSVDYVLVPKLGKGLITYIYVYIYLIHVIK